MLKFHIGKSIEKYLVDNNHFNRNQIKCFKITSGYSGKVVLFIAKDNILHEIYLGRYYPVYENILLNQLIERKLIVDSNIKVTKNTNLEEDPINII